MPGGPLEFFQGQANHVRERTSDTFYQHLAAVLEQCDFFIGHDSGISHIAAAVGIPCCLLFGPTDPKTWAPANGDARVLEAPQKNLASLSVNAAEEVLSDAYELMRIGIRT